MSLPGRPGTPSTTPTPHRVNPGSMPSTRTRTPLGRVFDTLWDSRAAAAPDTRTHGDGLRGAAAAQTMGKGGRHGLPHSADGRRAAAGVHRVRGRAAAQAARRGGPAERR